MEANYTTNVTVHYQQIPILLFIPINTTSKTISNKIVGVNEVNILCRAPISKTTNHITVCHVKATVHVINISCDELLSVG
jgi:hypothetical protein